MKKFTNELGNEISVEVTKEMLEEGIEGVCIRIEGPTSLSENYLTKREVEVLRDELTGLTR